METRINEIAAGIYRLSTFVPEIAPPAGFTFNQFLILGEEPCCSTRACGGCSSRPCSGLKVDPPERLRWIAFGHYEADECGAMNEWLAVAPHRRWRTARPDAWSRSTTWPTARLVSCRTGNWSTSVVESGSAISTLRIPPTAGTRVSCSKRARARCCAATCSPSWAMALR